MTSMLTLRPTLILAGRVRLTTALPSLAVVEPYADWCVHTFMAGRYRYLLFTNTASLLSVVTDARGVTTVDALIKRFALCAAPHLRACGQEAIWSQHIAPELTAVQFGRVPNRSVQGSMNDLAWLAECALVEGASSVEASQKLLHVPMGALQMAAPLRTFAGLAG